eukprot:m.29518 g.29518  ORF g.29518 m.29518 type:complete len:419 (+) comp8110_c0_seq1:134-1390(+)
MAGLHLTFAVVLVSCVQFGSTNQFEPQSVALFAHSPASRSDPNCLVSFLQSQSEVDEDGAFVFGSSAGANKVSKDGGTTWSTVDIDVELGMCTTGPTTLAPDGNIQVRGLFEGVKLGYLPSPEQGPWVSKGHYLMTLNTEQEKLSIIQQSGNDTWAETPHPIVLLAPESGGVSRMSNGGLIATPWIWYSNEAIPKPGSVCCNGSVVAYVSEDNGATWQFKSTIASKQHMGGFPSEEGPNENDVVLLKDGKTILCVIRKDGGDGVPDHRHVPYMLATSTDQGATWTLKEAPASLMSARPRATVLPNGALIIAGGRPALNMWVSPDGFGQKWITIDIPTEHNKLVTNSSLKYCDEFLNANSTLGWAQSSAYTQIVAVSNDEGLVCYERQGSASGGYAKHMPKECLLNGSDVFCMKFRISP